MFFQTKRLYVREFNINDSDPLIDMQSNANVVRHTTGTPKTREESMHELEKIIDNYKNNKDKLIMAVIRKDNDNFIGACALSKNVDSEYEIGYRFDETHWGKGYGKEIASGLVKYAFQELNLKQIVAYVNKENYSSVKILEGLNFRNISEYIENDTNDLVLYYKMINPNYKE